MLFNKSVFFVIFLINYTNYTFVLSVHLYQAPLLMNPKKMFRRILT